MPQPNFNQTEKALTKGQLMQQRLEQKRAQQQAAQVTGLPVQKKKVSFGLIMKLVFVLALIILALYLFMNPEKVMDPVNSFMSQFGV